MQRARIDLHTHAALSRPAADTARATRAALTAALSALGLACLCTANAQASPGPDLTAPITPIAAPRDRPYPGEIDLMVDATDIQRRVYHVHETLSGVDPDTVLLYPQWIPGAHAPEGTIDRLAGLRISAGGKLLTWTRDPANVWAFRVHAPRGVSTLQIDFDYLSPTSDDVGDPEVSAHLLMIEWNEVVLYPAGYYARQIPVRASVTLPAGWHFGSALPVGQTEGARTRFRRINLATLVDSPLYAGRYASRLDLDPGAAVPVHLDLFADQPDELAVPPAALQAYRSLVQQAYRLFGSHHYDHYDFLFSLSDQIQHNGLEHHQSSENGSYPHYFTEWDKYAFDHDLLPHEYTHSWNGKFRRPFNLWTPNFNVPMQDTLLWVYEGLTQYWGHVLAARAGLRTLPQTLDEIASFAAYEQSTAGHEWRALQDTTNDEIINPRRPQSWRSWQLFEDYYEQGALIWLDADTLIRQLSHGRRSLDDFARAFFGIDNGSFVTRTYTFQDIVRTLNAVQPYDWSQFLRQRLDSTTGPMLDGIRRGGYRLVYTDTEGTYGQNEDEARHRVELLYSIGVSLDDKDRPGAVREVLWGSPAWQAQLTTGSRIVAVNGLAYSSDVIQDAIRSAHASQSPIELIVRTGDRYRSVRLDYHGGLRYPHLQRDASQPALLDAILAPRS
jgi:predicted metalloprotease with PDZ domain